MQFSKAQKVLHDTNNFNPPPGYYSHEDSTLGKSIGAVASKFAKQERFGQKEQSTNPGPGAYYNDKAEKIRKRIIQQAKKKQSQYKSRDAGESDIKISSIPSIPKKSTTRVYEELAPGILILHEQQNEGANIGPGSYNVSYQMGYKKPISYKINPEHKKKIQPPHEPQIKVPTIAQQIRDEKRQMYKKNLIKSTGINKGMISPSDLCLEVIILREKLLRSEQNPPPGAYYNEKYQSSFKPADPDLLPEYQLMMGKQERFKQDIQSDIVGPGAYQIKSTKQKQGGYIMKDKRDKQSKSKNHPGPGSYKVQNVQQDPVNPRGNYPPIFGSGSNRFYSANYKSSEVTPGPGSYKVDGLKKKKQKYIKIKKQYYQSQMVKPQSSQPTKQLFSVNGDKSRSVQTSFFKQRNNQKNSNSFASKVQRFTQNRSTQNAIGPGDYDLINSSLAKPSFNKNQYAYTGSKQPRFDDSIVRPKLGPGAYFSNDNSSSKVMQS